MTSVDGQTHGETSSEKDDGRRLALAVSQSTVIFYTATAGDDVPLSYISENVEALTGHTAANMLSSTAYRNRHINLDDLPGYLQTCQSLIAGGAGGSATCRYRFRLAEGEERWYRDDLSLSPGDGAMITGCMIDISAEMAAKESHQAEQRGHLQAYQDAVESIDGGFCVTDRNDRIIACNTMLASSTGFGPDHFIGQPRRRLVREILPKIEIFDGERTEQSPAWIDKIFDRISRPSGRGLELKMAAGFWVRATFAPTMEGGQIILITDINARKKLEREMRESAARFRLLVESHPLPVMLVDVKTGSVLYESPAASALLGHEWSPDLDFKVQDMYADPEERKQVVAELRRDGELRNRPIKQRREDGSLYWVSITSKLTVYEGREVHITSIVDITEEQERETALARAHETLEDAIESLSEGFALYDHDDRLVAFNSRYLEYNKSCADLIKPGMSWEDHVRTGAARDPYFDSDSEMELFIRNHKSDLRTGSARLGYEYTQSDGRWFQCSWQPTRQGGTVVTVTEISESKALERELRESVEHFRMLVESHPLPVILVDMETGRVLYESPAASAIFGREWSPEFNFKVQELYADPSERKKFVDDLRRTGELRNWPLRYKRQDGSLYWISLTSKLIMYEGREAHITSIVDLTEQQERENALALAHQLLEDAIEALSEGFALFDQDDRLVTFNSRFCEFNSQCQDILKPGTLFEDIIRTGMERGQYYGERAEIEQFLEGHMADHERGQARFGFDYRLASGNWFQYSSQPTRQGGIVVTLTDISKSREMQRALRESEASVRQILEGCPAPITVSRGHDSVILYESPASKNLFRRGGEDDNKVARDYWADKSDRDGIWRELQQAGLVQDRTIQFRDGGGHEFWASYSARLVENQGEQMIVSAILDLTEYRALEEEMVRQREVLHVSEKMVAMGELLASVSHELNNPLSVVVGQALLLQETTTDEAVAARAERIVSSADRCARIVKTFLAMARQRPRERSPVNVNDLIELALEVAGYALRTSDITVVRNQMTALPGVVVDADQIIQVFTNLMVNAEQALREVEGPRQLTITTLFRARSKMVVIKIKDNGPGIPDDIRRRIFEPFFTTKKVGDGTGIGLALCHRILQSHGGKIKLESAPGAGASFVMRLPAQSGTLAADETQQQAPGAAARLAVLIIDDEVFVAELLADILQLDGHETVIASNGMEGLALLEKQHFDVILSDLRMPEMDGPALFSRLQVEKPQFLSRIGFLTGDTLSKDMEGFLGETGRPYIEKPITPSDVRDLMARILSDIKIGIQAP